MSPLSPSSSLSLYSVAHIVNKQYVVQAARYDEPLSILSPFPWCWCIAAAADRSIVAAAHASLSLSVADKLLAH